MIRLVSDGGAVADRLARAARSRREADSLRARLAAATHFADGTTDRVRQARERLADEDRDVERLESVSWSRVLSALRGGAATDRERERAERDAARYALADAEARDAVAWRDVEGLQAQLDALGDVEADFAAALGAKEEWALRQDPAAAAELAGVAQRCGELAAEDREAREVHAAGMVAREHLLRALDLLERARSWSTWDTFGGGGMFSDMMKYDRLDEVGHVLRDADLALERFSRELADLRLAGVEAVNVDGLTRAFDMWFDNIFTDLAVRDRIRDAHERVGDVLRVVESCLDDLTSRGHAIAAELEELSGRRERTLLG
jgi:hypothetical protein